MEPEMKSACLKAAVKLGIGLSLLGAVIGIRLVTTTRDGVESGIKELERLDEQIASESISTNSGTREAEPAADDSIVSRLAAGVREHMPSSDSRSGDGDKLVSCRLGGSTHFMRADDCAIRGGESTVLSRERSSFQ
jgi:hypothetical protein